MQEVSLCLATSGLSISLLEHTRGLANKIPDALSMQFQCAGGWALASSLDGVPERETNSRTASWWRTSCGPLPTTSRSRCREGGPQTLLVPPNAKHKLHTSASYVAHRSIQTSFSITRMGNGVWGNHLGSHNCALRLTSGMGGAHRTPSLISRDGYHRVDTQSGLQGWVVPSRNPV